MMRQVFDKERDSIVKKTERGIKKRDDYCMYLLGVAPKCLLNAAVKVLG